MVNVAISGESVAHGNHRSLALDTVSGPALPFSGLSLRCLGSGLLVGDTAVLAPPTGMMNDVTLWDRGGITGELPQRT